MKFLIEPAAAMRETEKKVYKVFKWIPIGLIQYPCVKRTIYEIDIESLDELVEMCEDYSRGFSGVLIQGISSDDRKEMFEAGIYTDAKLKIICYNSWIE